MIKSQNPYAQVYFEMFILVTCLIWLPEMKLIAYVAPYLALAFLVYRTRSGLLVYRLLSMLTVYVLFCFIQYIFAVQVKGWDMVPFNYLFSFITYGSFILVLLIPNRFLEDAFDYEKYAKFLAPLLLIQGLIGIFQFCAVHFTGAFHILDGDAVQGTIGLLSFVKGEAGFGNQMFSINISLLLVFFAPYMIVYKKGYLAFGSALLSLLLAGVIHVFICLAAAVVILMSYFYVKILFRRLKTIILIIAGLGIAFVLGEVIFPGITNSAKIYYNFLVHEGHSPKNKAIRTALVEIPDQHPDVIMLGMGAGQYASRSGLIGSGRYFSVYISLLPNRTSTPFNLYAQNVWKDYMNRGSVYGASTMHRPFASLISIFVEFGAVVSAGLFFYFLILLGRSRRLYFHFLNRNSPLEQQLALGLGIAIVFLLTIGVFENYLETPQAILHGLILFKISYVYLLKKNYESN